jgi:hypothetical protein
MKAYKKRKKAKMTFSLNISQIFLFGLDYFLVNSLETVSFFLPLALLLARTFLPFFDSILDLNPCLFFLFLFEG